MLYDIRRIIILNELRKIILTIKITPKSIDIL
jgi:hypothetical protein